MKFKVLYFTAFCCLGMAACSGELLLTGIDPCPLDSDCDGVQNLLDNCPDDFNPKQTDTDHNGVGEICEPFLPGGVDCSSLSCEASFDCAQRVRFCPDGEAQLGMHPSCCDGTCFASEGDTICPAGTCPDYGPVHCQGTEDCGANEACHEGCCIPIEGSECACDCPPEAEGCILCPPESPVCGPPEGCVCECPPETEGCVLCPPEPPVCGPPPSPPPPPPPPPPPGP